MTTPPGEHPLVKHLEKLAEHHKKRRKRHHDLAAVHAAERDAEQRQTLEDTGDRVSPAESEGASDGAS